MTLDICQTDRITLCTSRCLHGIHSLILRNRVLSPICLVPVQYTTCSLWAQAATGAGDPYFHQVLYSTLIEVGATQQLLALDSRAGRLEPFLRKASGIPRATSAHIGPLQPDQARSDCLPTTLPLARSKNPLFPASCALNCHSLCSQLSSLFWLAECKLAPADTQSDATCTCEMKER